MSGELVELGKSDTVPLLHLCSTVTLPFYQAVRLSGGDKNSGLTETFIRRTSSGIMENQMFSPYWWISVVVVGLLVSLGGAYIKPVIDALFRYLSLSSLNRQIRQVEGELAYLDKLAKSEKSILLFGFSGVFAMIGVVILIFAIQTLLPHDNELTRISVALLSILAAVGCIYLTKLFKRLYDYPESREEIEKRITELKSKKG